MAWHVDGDNTPKTRGHGLRLFDQLKKWTSLIGPAM